MRLFLDANILFSAAWDDAAAAGGYDVPEHGQLEAAVASLRSCGALATAYRCDVTDEVQVAALVDSTVETYGRLDIMVNNAGVALGLGPITDVGVDEWDTTQAVIARGTFLGTREAVRVMRASGEGGRVVNIASQAGRTGWPQLAAYSAAKFAVIGLTQSVAREVGPEQITVNAVCPGTVDTPMLELDGGPMDLFSQRAGISREQARQRQERLIPLRRFATPQDVAAMVVFLCGPGGDFVTGAAMNVSGGEEVH